MKRVRFNQTAVSQADEIEHWWRRNRRSAPNLFRDELAEAIELLADTPDIGVIAEDVPVAGAAARRRSLASRIRAGDLPVPSPTPSGERRRSG